METVEHVKENLDYYNQILRDKSVEEVIEFALSISSRPILTSNFAPYSASLIHAVSKAKPGVNLVWCDTGFNTDATVEFSQTIKEELPVNLCVYKSLVDHNFDEVPSSDSDEFEDFVNTVKLEPFQRALDEHNPDLWFTNIRRGQTAYRDTLNILSVNGENILKVSPFYFWSEPELHNYLKENNLPNEFRYYDPTKPKSNLECGIQL